MLGHFGTVLVGLVRQYGHIGLFVYAVLETAFVLHFAPAEVVIPATASVLVDGALSFAFVVFDVTAGAAIGSFLLYYLFDQHEEWMVTRFGPVFHVSERDVDRSRSWFGRWGEHSVLWGRLVPFLRAFVSIPAGVSHMDRSKFLFYSTVGAAVFNTVLIGLATLG